MKNHFTKMTVAILAIVVLGQWLALAKRASGDAACPVAGHEGLVNPPHDDFSSSLDDALLAEPVSLVEHYSPAVPGISTGLDGRAAAVQESLSAGGSTAAWSRASGQMSQTAQRWSSTSRNAVADSLILLAIFAGSSLVLYLLTRRASRKGAAESVAAPVKGEAFEPREELLNGLWIVEVNIDDASRYKVFRAIRLMGLRVVRRGKYSLALGNYTDKTEASRVVQQLYKRYGIRGWLMAAPENKPDRYHI